MMFHTMSLVGGMAVGAALPPYPPSRREEVREVLHGVELVDHYRWLEDQQAPETRTWIEAQNQYTMGVMGGPETRGDIIERLDELTRVDQVYTPSMRGDTYFYYARAADQELPVFSMRVGLDGEETVLLDPHCLSDDLTVTLQALSISEDGSRMVYGVREGGEDELTLKVMDIALREDLPDVLPKARYMGCVLLPDNETLYYGQHTEQGTRIYRHSMGTDPTTDAYVFGEGYGPEQSVGVSTSEDGRWLLLHVYYGAGAKQTELYIKDLETDGPIVTIVKDIEAQFYGTIIEDRLYIETDWEAPFSRIMVGDPAQPGTGSWSELIPERDYALKGASFVGHKLFLSYLENVISRMEVCDITGAKQSEIAGPSLGSVSGMSGRWAQEEGFYSFSSYNVPSTIYRYNVRTGVEAVWSRTDVPFEPDDFVVEQTTFVSKDGTTVPMFVARKKDLVLDGSAPAFLTGYGGFQGVTEPGFSSTAAFWMERGGVFAAPNLRGGSEFGEAWHEGGMLGNKQNTFDDFIAAAEHLVAKGYSSPARIGIIGGSNGGLLVGAAVTQRPDLFGAVVCTYPLLDMVRYHKFLLGPLWVPEYGSADDVEQFEYLRAYSPYQNVSEGAEYPAVLFVTGDSDTRVDPMHARKMCALLQHASGSDRPILLHYDVKLGHSGGRPVNKSIEDSALQLDFLLTMLGCSE